MIPATCRTLRAPALLRPRQAGSVPAGTDGGRTFCLPCRGRGFESLHPLLEAPLRRGFCLREEGRAFLRPATKAVLRRRRRCTSTRSRERSKFAPGACGDVRRARALRSLPSALPRPARSPVPARVLCRQTGGRDRAGVQGLARHQRRSIRSVPRVASGSRIAPR
jgi:hypothetical protein